MSFSVTFILIAITVAFSLPGVNDPARLSKWVFNPYVVRVRKEWYRVVSHAFVHAGWVHLLVNMFVLFFFGHSVENYLRAVYGHAGVVYFVLLYLGGILFATLPAFKKHSDNPRYNSVGASGAVAAVLFAHILLKPTEMLYLYFAIPLPSFVFGIGYLWYEAYMDKRGGDRIAHDAHFWGAIFGVAFMIALDFNNLLMFFNQVSYWIQNLFS